MTAQAERVRLLTVEPAGTRVVRVDDGVTQEEWKSPPTLTNTTVFAEDLPRVIRVVCRRPLSGWRFWHTRRGLVRAVQATKATVRQEAGLLGEGSPAVTLRDRWTALAVIREWCEDRGLPFKSSAGGFGVACLQDPRFAPRFAPLKGRMNEEGPIRAAVYGGRAESFFTGKYVGRCCLMDRSGAYNAVMRTAGLPYPYDYVQGVNFRTDGVSDVTIEERGPFPVLAAGVSSDYPEGRKRGVWLNTEIRRALDWGAKLKRIHGGIHFIARTKCLQPVAEFLAAEREIYRAVPVLNTFLKMVPNALIGRFAALPSVCVNRLEAGDWRNHPRFLSAVKVGEGMVSVELALGRRPTWYAAAWAATVLALQRLELHEQMTSLSRHGYRILACDTDGMLVGCGDRALPPLPKGYRFQWTGEACDVRGPKTYTAWLPGGVTGRRAGVPRDRKDRLKLA